jgi:hypothetical protein
MNAQTKWKIQKNMQSLTTIVDTINAASNAELTVMESGVPFKEIINNDFPELTLEDGQFSYSQNLKVSGYIMQIKFVQQKDRNMNITSTIFRDNNVLSKTGHSSHSSDNIGTYDDPDGAKHNILSYFVGALGGFYTTPRENLKELKRAISDPSFYALLRQNQFDEGKNIAPFLSRQEGIRGLAYNGQLVELETVLENAIKTYENQYDDSELKLAHIEKNMLMNQAIKNNRLLDKNIPFENKLYTDSNPGVFGTGYTWRILPDSIGQSYDKMLENGKNIVFCSLYKDEIIADMIKQGNGGSLLVESQSYPLMFDMLRTGQVQLAIGDFSGSRVDIADYKKNWNINPDVAFSDVTMKYMSPAIIGLGNTLLLMRALNQIDS